MKKICFLLLILCFVFLTGCTNYGKQFTKKEVFNVDMILTKEEVYDDIVEAINHYNDTDKKTINFKSITNGYLINLEGCYKEDKSEDNIKISLEAEGRLAVVFYAKIETHVKDGYLYKLTSETDRLNKEENIVKTKEVYTKDSDIGFTLECISEEFVLKDDYQFGKDKNGRIIIQDINGYFRMVIENNEIIFVGYERAKGELLYFDIEYDVANIKYQDLSEYSEQ